MSRAICVVLVCGMAARAHAEPRQDPTAGRAVFTGATMANPTSIELNPGALELDTTDEIYVAATTVIDQLGIQRRTLDLATGALGPGPNVDDTELGPGGTVGIVWHLRNRGALGGLLRTTPLEMFPSGHRELQYHILSGSERSYAFAFGGGIKIFDELTFGASFSWEVRHLHLRYARDTALAQGSAGLGADCGGQPCGLGNPAATEIDDVRVHSDLFSQNAFALNVGAVYQVVKNVFIGAAYHTSPGVNAVENELHGNMEVIRAPRDGGTTERGGGTVLLQEPVVVDAEVRARLPEQLDLHVGFRWENLSRFAAYDVRGYGTALAHIPGAEWTERPQGFHDPVALWAGVEQVETHELWQWRFGGRLGLETSALPDARTSPTAIAPLSYTADVGAEVRIPGTSMILQLSYGLQYFPTVHVGSSTYDPLDQVACIDSGYDYSTPGCASVRRGYAIDTAAGDYSRFEHAFRIALRYDSY